MDALFLSFDELDGTGTRYYYTVIHCDRNWIPTAELSPFDYMGGYREGEINDYELSSGTHQDYLHYKLTIPNEEVNWKISGNYLLVVYESGMEEDPILTRRFMISEEKISFAPEVSRPANVSKQRTHQEIDFIVSTKNFPISNPRTDLTCVVLQNGRWDNAIPDVTPRLVSGEILSYDYQDKIVFPAGKEFRNLDISSLKYRSESVLDVEEYTDGYSTILKPDEPRVYKSYLWHRDLNGMFVPYNRDYDRKYITPDSLASALALVNRFNYRELYLGSDYTEVLFTLESPGTSPQDIYIVGGMTDWKFLPEYKMVYDEGIDAYICRAYLKQGYYNFQYAIPGPGDEIDFSTLEGDWYATENLYLLLGYYRPRGGQYDQLIGAKSFNSNYP
jgi:hypothetical protein